MASVLQFLCNKLFFDRTVKCFDPREQVSMDDPSFGSMDPHLRIEDEPDDFEAMPMGKNPFPNRPPSFDTLLNNIKAITKKVEHVKGFKFDIAGGLSNNFHLSHSWSIPNQAGPASPQARMKRPAESNYMLSAQYLGGSLKTMFDEPKIILTGRMDSTGKLDAAIIKKYNDRVRFRLSAMYPNSDVMFSQMHLDVDIDGEDYTHTIKYGTGIFSFNMMQTISKNLVAGFEWMLLRERNMALLNYAFKYTKDKHSYFAQYTAPNETLTLAYSLSLKKRAFIVSELEFNVPEGATLANIGYRQKFTHSEIIATLNSKGKISTVLTMNGFAYQLKLCAIANYLRDTYKFGYGISMGQVG